MIKKLISKSDKIYIAGHNGMAGSAIYRALKDKGYENFIFMNRSELDLENQMDVNAWFERNKLNLRKCKYGHVHFRVCVKNVLCFMFY